MGNERCPHLKERLRYVARTRLPTGHKTVVSEFKRNQGISLDSMVLIEAVNSSIRGIALSD